MVAVGSLLALLGLTFVVLRKRRPQLLNDVRVLRVVALCTPLGFIAVEAGWTVTEVGRQPWIIYGVMRTADALSPMPGLVWPMLGISSVYGMLSLITWFVLARLIHAIEYDSVAADSGEAALPEAVDG
jgi:cytochrome d ubiquinol oxidase subunit I